MNIDDTELGTVKGAHDIPVVLIEPSRGWPSLNLRELWAYRELLYFLIWRDVKVKYKQTIIGAAWALVQPIMTMVVFTFVFKKIANIPSEGFPYPIFAFSALLPWNLFAGGLSRSTTSLVAQSNLISKIYFPRLIIPLSATLYGIVDFAIALVFLIGMMLWYNIFLTWRIFMVPVITMMAVSIGFAVGLWLGALNVRYRDVGYTIPFLMQLWMFASPVAYSVNAVPGDWKLLFILNPMTAIIEGFRWALLGASYPNVISLVSGAVVTTVLLLGGIVYFKRMEKTFADMV